MYTMENCMYYKKDVFLKKYCHYLLAIHIGDCDTLIKESKPFK